LYYSKETAYSNGKRERKREKDRENRETIFRMRMLISALFAQDV